MIRLSYDPELVEEAVLLAENRLPPAEARAFRRERDRTYGVAEADAREAQFRALHLRWFTRLDFGSAITGALHERPELADSSLDGRVVRAVTAHEEGADLIDCVPPDGRDSCVMLVLRLRPSTLIHGDMLRPLLRHELLHVADMLSPTFGYERTLPPSGDGPSHDNILRDRYRVLWDITIDGRLVRAGLLDGRVRDARWREFQAAFEMSSEGRPIFDKWFDRMQPTHAALVEFISIGSASDTRHRIFDRQCPLCHFPVANLDPRPERLSVAAREAIQTAHPAWTIDRGLCTQCLDLCEARCAERRIGVNSQLGEIS